MRQALGTIHDRYRDTTRKSRSALVERAAVTERAGSPGIQSTVSLQSRAQMRRNRRDVGQVEVDAGTSAGTGRGRWAKQTSMSLAFLAVVFASSVGWSGLWLFEPESASAADLSLNQCNGVSNSGGLTVQCIVSIVNTLTGDPATTGSVVTINGGAPVASGDVVTVVDQCNGSANGGGGTLLCSVTVVNNIAISGGIAPAGATVNQCNANQPDGLGTAPNPYTPSPATTSGATITQCNGSGNGGGSRVVCSTNMTTNLDQVPIGAGSGASPQRWPASGVNPGRVYSTC